jgi:hypothetical protein
MKAFDFSKKFVDIHGVEIQGETIGNLIAASLYNGGSNDYPLLPEQKFNAYKICTKLVANNLTVELSDEDIVFLTDFCSKCFFVGAYGQIIDILNK